jgi:phosphopantetheine adenylyltransferase
MAKKVIVAEETWTQLRLEYISSSEVSIRGLQKKYGIPYNQIRNRCENEKWLEQRDAVKTQSTQKSIDLISDYQSEKCTRAFRVADKVMDKLEEVVDKIDPEDEYAVKKLKDVTGAIKNMKEIGLFRSSLDQAEQEARINKLRKDAEEEETDTEITITFTEEGYAD